MSNLKVIQIERPAPKADWFRSKATGAVYRRGPNGLCIDTNGGITPVEDAYADGNTYDVFDKNPDYVPMYPGDQIVITL